MSKTFSVLEVADFLQAKLHGNEITITTIAKISDAKSGALSFVTCAEKYAEQLTAALAAGAVVLVPTGQVPQQLAAGAVLEVANPRYAFAAAVTHFIAPKPTPGIAATAVIDPTATVHETASVGAYTVIGPGAVIGEHAEIRNHVVIGRDVRIGAHTLVKSHAVIGEEGFGIEIDPEGNNFRVPHVGSAVIGAHAEIGSFTTVCSGTISPTVVSDYVKIDDHVHIAHNVTVHENSLIIAGAIVAGSVVVEKDVWFGPQAVAMNGITIGQNAQLGLSAVVLKSIGANEIHVGNPSRKIGERDPR